MTRPRQAWVVCYLILTQSVVAGSVWQRSSDVRSLQEKGAYEEAEVAALAQSAAVREQYGERSVEAASAADLLVGALLLNGKGASAAALSAAERTLGIKEALFGSSHAALVPSLINLSAVLVEGGTYPRAITAAERAVKLRATGSPAETLELAEALDRLGLTLQAAGRYDDALVALERSLRIKEQALDAADVRLARTLHALGLVLQSKGSYDKAAIPIRRAEGIDAARGVDHPFHAETLTLLGLQLWFEGNLPQAREVSARAVAMAERTLRPHHPAIARSLRYLAGALFDLGYLVQARTLWERAVKIAESSYGPAHHETGEYLNDLALVERQLGQFASARQLWQQALRIAEGRFGTWDDRVATATYNLAAVHLSLGDAAGARQRFLRAIRIWERVRGREHPFVAVGLSGLATVIGSQGSPRQAIPLLERALAIRERSLGPSHRQVAQTLATLATTLAAVGDTARARASAERMLRIWESLAETPSPDLASAFALYGDVHVEANELPSARDYYQRALAIRSELLGTSHPRVAETRARLARTLARLGDDSAFAAALEAEQAGREHLRLMVRYLPERLSLTYAANRPRALGLIVSLTEAGEGDAATALDAVARARAVVFDEMARRARAGGGTSGPELASRWAALAQARQRLANLAVRNPSDRHPHQYRALIAEAQAEAESAERALAERSADFREELVQQALGLPQIRAAIPESSALVSFVLVDRTGEGPTATARHYSAFVLEAGSDRPVVVPLGSAIAIERAVHAWRHTTRPDPSTGRVPMEAAYRTAGGRLRNLVWDPVVPHLANVARVFVVPDGVLNLVNLAALPVGVSEYLADAHPTIHYLPTERDLLPPSHPTTTGVGLLTMGGPLFDKARSEPTMSTLRDGGCGTLQSMTFAALPGTLAEATDIAALWKASSSAGQGAHLSVAAGATEAAFKQHAPGRRVLHLATHGFFLGGDCAPAAVGTRAVGRVVPARGRPSAAVDLQNPLLLSGLAFAGANQRATAPPDGDDGILTAEEIAAMNLQGTEWAVLSACDTGLGEIHAGEGVFGLRRAFQIAGVRTVIMSLWSVEDESTRQWMRALYEARLVDRLDTAAAVRAASLRVLRDRRAKGLSTHPFYWGAFVAAGDWK